MNNDYDITLVERYFDRQLSESEAVEFQHRVRIDMSFKALVDQERLLIQQIRQTGLQKDLNYLKTLEKNLSNPNSTSWQFPRLVWHYSAAAAIVAIMVVVGIWVYSPRQTSEELFTAYFKPYANIFEPTVRSSQTTPSTQRVEAFQAYEQGDYQKAARLFTALNKEKPEPGILLLLGNSNLILGNLKEAENNFITLRKDFDELDLQAQWYLSLCYLKSGDTKRARAILNELGGTEVTYAEKAKELLKKVD